MSRVVFIPPARQSRSMAALKSAVNNRLESTAIALRSDPQQSRATQREGDVFVNWGGYRDVAARYNLATDAENTVGYLDGNAWRATNKLGFFTLCQQHDIPSPEFTTDHAVARSWQANDGRVVVRQTLRGHSGQGIIIVNPGQTIPDAPLYTKYTPRTNEYRVHIVCGNIVDIQRKVRVREVPDENVNWEVRNLAGGFAYGREDLQLDRRHLEQISVIIDKMKRNNMLSDFAAVDLIRSAQGGNMLALEVNSAPGLTGTTLERYTDALVTKLNSMGVQ